MSRPALDLPRVCKAAVLVEHGQPLELREGIATAPDRPGHGVAFDWDALAAHRVEAN